MHESLLKFKPYVEKGLLREVISPCKRLVLYNYTDHCTYEKAWDEVTLNARGTVYEIATGKVIARAFPKFFNYGELSEDKKKEVLESQDFEVYEKMDGSLGIVYFYDGEWRVNTRGSFTSDQAVKGKEMLDNLVTKKLPKNETYLVEIIYPENKIIVDYGKQETLTLLAVYDQEGNEIKLKYYDFLAFEQRGFTTPLIHKFNTIQELMNHLKTLDHTEEGYVVRLKDGYRVKFKSEEYLALARIMSNMSPLTFWSKMENGKIDRQFLEQLPEEFREECDKIADKLEAQHFTKKTLYNSQFLGLDIEGKERKEVAFLCKKYQLNLPVMFALLDGKEETVDKIIMKEIKPVGNILKE